MKNYAKWLRGHVGHDPIFLNAASGIITDGKRVLLQRKGNGEKTNTWSLPGGIMEIQERPHDTVKRELLEETGLEVEVDRFVGVYTTPELVTYPSGDVCQMVTQVFTVKITGGKLKADGDETLELKYFGADERPTLFRPHIEKALQDFEADKFGVSD